MRLGAVTMAAVLTGALAGNAVAGALDAQTARKQLYSPRNNEVVFVENSGLSAGDLALLKTLFNLSSKKVSPAVLAAAGVSAADFNAALEQFRATQYYGAMAVAPSRGVVSPGTQMVQNLHTPEAARAAALAACKAAADADCVVVAEVLPKRFKPKELMLSQSATADFADYRKGGGPKALAASGSTAAYAVARGYGSAKAALAECNKLAGTEDCTVVVSDR